MIFQSLISLYDRLNQNEKVPPMGFSDEDIGFVVTLDKQGRMVGPPEDLRTKIKTGVYDYFTSTVPYSNKVNVRSSSAATTPNFLVDKADYIFGMSGNTKKKVHHEEFKKLIDAVCGDSDDDGVVAVRAFLNQWQPSDAAGLDHWKELCGMHAKWVAFRLEGEQGFVHERPAVQTLWANHVAAQDYPRGYAFVDGKKSALQSQYAQYKFGSGAALVSFNEKAYESYGKQRGENAPISVDAEFKSATALKYLLRSRTQRIRIGDATTVFWAERACAVETFMGQILNPASDDTDFAAVRKFLESVRSGTLPAEIEEDEQTRFYILGLSPNKARLAVRFWLVCSVGDMMTHLRRHFSDLEMEPSSERDIAFPGIWHLTKETARETKDISPLLSGALTRSVLTGADYPHNLFQGVLGRIRADRKITYLKASIVKAVLKRNHKKEVPMSLDPHKKEVAYLLGRLFAVLEKAQLDALGKINSTIKDRFYGAASATPASVFPRLLKLAHHHIEKADYGYVSDQRIAQIMEHVDTFPSHLNLEDQGLFAIGYYHQKNAIWRKQNDNTDKGENHD